MKQEMSSYKSNIWEWVCKSGNHYKLSKNQCPSNKEKEEKWKMCHFKYDRVSHVYYGMYKNMGHSISTLSIYMSYPGLEHCEMLKWLIKYFKGSKELELFFRTGIE